MNRIPALIHYQCAPLRNAQEESASDMEVNYPHVAKKICLLWPEPILLEEYLKSLVFDNRVGRRQGFSFDTYYEISFLYDLALETGAIFTHDGCIWDPSNV